LASGGNILFIAEDGTVHDRIRVTWDLPTDQFVLSGGLVEIQFKTSAAVDWEIAPDSPADQNFSYVSPVEPGVSYDVRIRFINALKSKSAFTAPASHVVVRKTDSPADVTGFSASQNGEVVNFRWVQVVDNDLAGYEIRFGERENTNWPSATALTKVTRGTAITNAMVPMGDWTFFIKAIDTTGNESANAAQTNAVVSATFATVLQRQQAPDWTGVL
jgi:predicted phage tail protein